MRGIPLTDTQRTSIIDRALEDKPSTDIAAEHGLDPSTINRALVKAEVRQPSAPKRVRKSRAKQPPAPLVERGWLEKAMNVFGYGKVVAK